MTYRVEYNGGDLEVGTLDAALDNAKHAIAADVGPISGWSVEHDEMINDWFIQGIRSGEPIGPTAVVSGPEPVTPTAVAPVSPARHLAADDDRPYRVSFAGGTPAEVFAMATTWLAGRPDVTEVDDVAWAADRSAHRLRIYFS
jgi:hypothetical protein